MSFVFSGFDPFSLILTAVFFVLSWMLLHKDEKAALVNKIPGPKTFPFLGNIKEILEPKYKLVENVKKRREKFGPVFRMWLGREPVVVLSRPEEIEAVLRGTKHTEKSFGYKYFNEWLGTGLITAHGPKWAAHRKLITPTFHFTILQKFIDVFQENSHNLIEELSKRAETGQEFDIYPLITLCTLDVICETAMGTKVNALSQNQSEYVKSVYRLSSLIANRIGRFWLHPTFIYKMVPSGKEYYKHLKVVHDFTGNVIKKRKEALMNATTDEFGVEDGKKPTFLDLLLKANANEAKTSLTDEELREEVNTFMFAGHDTTAATLVWALFLLGHHPEIQEKAYEEVKSVFENKKEDGWTLNDLAEMKLLERIIKETLRILPPVFSISRKLEDDVEFGGYLVPKGVTAIIGIYTLHRDPQYYENPEVFDPDRFLPENCAKRHPYAYIPFSAGPRNCLGQKFAMLEEKVILSNLLYRFKFQLAEKIDEIHKVPEIIFRPRPGLKIKIYKR